MSTSQMLAMDFDNKSPFAESSFDSSFNYMDSGLDYFQYPPASPNLGASVGREFDSQAQPFFILQFLQCPRPLRPWNLIP